MLTRMLVLIAALAATPAGSEECTPPTTKDLEARLQFIECQARSDAAKKTTNDRELDEHRALYFALGGVKAQGLLGYTDNDGANQENDDLPTELDDTEIWNLKIGWFDKPIARDLRFLWGGSAAMDAYRKEGADDPCRYLFWDAWKFDAHIGYGDKVEEEDDTQQVTTETGSFKYIGIRYEVPLDHLIPGSEPFEE